jgi:hypothetical protein
VDGGAQGVFSFFGKVHSLIWSKEYELRPGCQEKILETSWRPYFQGFEAP